MSGPNFSSLARLEVFEKFLWVGGWWGLQSHFHVKPNRCVVLCWGWGFDNLIIPDQKVLAKISFEHRKRSTSARAPMMGLRILESKLESVLHQVNVCLAIDFRIFNK